MKTTRTPAFAAAPVQNLADAESSKALPAQERWPITIGQAAQLSGISPKMLRHYEGLGLLGGVARTDSGYRLYQRNDVHTLQFIKRARDLGFSMADIGELVGLWMDNKRSSAKVKKVTQRHLLVLEQRITQLQAMQRSLQNLNHCCRGDERPDCPILDDLAGLH